MQNHNYRTNSQNNNYRKKSQNPQVNKCYFPPLDYSIRETMTHVRTDSDEEVCQMCCYPCTLPTPYVDTEPIIDVTCIPIIWILGGTDADKQNQCSLILEHLYCMVHISVKNMLCSELLSRSKRGQIIKMMVDKGAQVPSELIIEMIKEKILETRSTTAGYLITGFPRERNHGLGFEKAIAAPSVVIYLQVSVDTLLERHMARKNSNGHQSTTADDSEIETLRPKFEKIQNHTIEILQDFWSKVHYVDGEQSENDICCNILQILNPIMSDALAYNNKNHKLKKLLVGQS